MRKIQFKAGSTSQEVEVANGGYRQDFKRAEQPFEVEEEHFAMLVRTGEFEEVKEHETTTEETREAEAHEGEGDHEHGGEQ